MNLKCLRCDIINELNFCEVLKMKSLADRSKLANILFVYLFERTDTKEVFYVGVTKYVGRRLNEHRRDLKRVKTTPLYVYMRDNDLELFKNVEVRLVAYCNSRDDANLIEAEYIEKYKNTVVNFIELDTRKYLTDPRWIKIKCVDTNEIFNDVMSCCRKFNVTRYKLMKAIDNNQAINNHKFIKV